MFYLIHQASEEQIINMDLLSSLRTLSKSVPAHSVPDIFSKLDAISYGLRININRTIALEDLAFLLTRAPSASTLHPPRPGA
jgi:hypothetical protein